MPGKFVLCRPEGGINDNLTQIEYCWWYAERANRTLVIDTARSGGFGLPFGRFFQPVKPGSNALVYPSPLLMQKLQRLRVAPACLQGRIHDYTPVYNPSFKNFADRETGERLTFDITVRHPEDVLVHDQCGGNLNALRCLSRLRLTDELRHDLRDRLALVGRQPYHAVVVRHSQDYRTDYRTAFESIYEQVRGQRLLVCSDSPSVIDMATAFFDQTELLTLPAAPYTEEEIPYAELMQRLDETGRYALVVKAIADLLCLANASVLHLTRLESGGIGGGYSGFVVLAYLLHREKQLIQQLLVH